MCLLIQLPFAHATQKVESIDRFLVKGFACGKYNKYIFIYAYAISQCRENPRIKIKNISLAGNSIFYANLD